MTNQKVLDFIKLPPTVDEFASYETKIHQQINEHLNDIRAYILSLMKGLSPTNKKIMFRIKTNWDKSITNFSIIQSSLFRAEPVNKEGKLSFHHELVVILDFLILDRVIDINTGCRNIEGILYNTETEELITYNLSQLQKAIHKIDELLTIRKMAQELEPSHDFFEKFVEDFRGEIAFLENMGAIHQYTELKKPSWGKKEYYRQLAQLFLATCNTILKTEKNTITFFEFNTVFAKRYPNVKADVKDLEKVAQDLNKSGVIGLIDQIGDQPKQIILAEDSELQAKLIEIAKNKGYLTTEEAITSLGKNFEEIKRTIKKMEDAGLVIEDSSYSTGTRFYFPSLDTE